MLDKIETYFKVDLKDNNIEQLFYVYLRIFIMKIFMISLLRMSAIVNRVLSGGQRATRKTINAFVGKNNFALQELRPPNPAELIQGTQQIALFPYKALGGELSKFVNKILNFVLNG